MLFGAIKSNYLQYKDDTKAIALWLATTAKSRNYSVDNLVSKGGQQPSGRLKGKARKLDRDKAKAADATKGASSTGGRKLPKYTIGMKDFVNLAEWIVGQNKPKIQVPASVISVLRRAISVCRSFGKHVFGEGTGPDESHQHFIDVLEHVHSVLSTRSVLKPKATQQRGKAKEEAPSNQFEALDVEEPSQAFLQAPDIPRSTEADCDIEIEDLEEVFFTLMLILDDCNSFRSIIFESWLGYRDHIYELIPVSVMTNTAIDLVRGFEEDAAHLFSKHGGSEQLLQKLWQMTCEQCRREESLKEWPDDSTKVRMYDAADDFPWPSYFILKAFFQEKDELSAKIGKDCEAWKYDPLAGEAAMAALGKFKENQTMLGSFLHEFHESYVVSNVGNCPFPEDELTRGLRLAFETNKLPLWLIFAAQVYLDLYHGLKDDVVDAFVELLGIAATLRKSTQANIQFHANLGPGVLPESNDLVIDEFLKAVDDFILKDHPMNLKQTPGQPDGFIPNSAMSVSHPLRCGLYAYGLRMKYQEIGLMFTNTWNSITWTYYLYKALQQDNYIESVWEDLELVMAHQSDVFGTSRLVSFLDYYKLFCLSYGVSATFFAKNPRKAKVPVVKSTDRGKLKNLAPIGLMFKERYRWESSRVDFTLQDLQDIITKVAARDQEAAQPPRPDENLSISQHQQSKTAKVSRIKAGQPQFTAVELLERLRDAMTSEQVEFNFDYLLLHRICMHFFTAVSRLYHCTDLLEEASKTLHGVVSIVFSLGVQEIKTFAVDGETVQPNTRPLLERVALTLEEVIKTHGDRMHEVMKDERSLLKEALGLERVFSPDRASREQSGLESPEHSQS
ncbi:hypothetical protein MMC10_009196 [Thelotrema lepadinum]|nr:hypothetical protein [Thelotrema lepadinum]